MNRYYRFPARHQCRRPFCQNGLLRQQFELLGLSNVQTYIQSGNVIFEMPL